METVELVEYLRACDRGLQKKGWSCTAAIVHLAAGRLHFLEKVIEAQKNAIEEQRENNVRLIRELDAVREELDALKEKHAPKKPKITLKGSTDYNTRIKCPTCHCSLLHSRANYCFICGQAIEWGR